MFLVILNVITSGYVIRYSPPMIGFKRPIAMKPIVVALIVIWSAKQSVIEPCMVFCFVILAKAPSMPSISNEIKSNIEAILKSYHKYTVAMIPKIAEK